MAKELKTQKMSLDAEDYFNDLPLSAIENVSDHQLFENFVDCELEIEIIRAIKYSVLDESQKKEIKECMSTLQETA
jgi:hypothetical protein